MKSASGSVRVGQPRDEGQDDARDAAPSEPPRSESSGRINASYASERPRTIPPAYGGPPESEQAVIVDAGVEQIALAPGTGTLESEALRRNRTVRIARGPMAAPPPAHHPTPAVAFAVPGSRLQHTVPMAERPRTPHPPSPTVLVRHGRPSVIAQVAVFAAMLALVMAVGLGVLVWRRPSWFGRDAARTAEMAPLDRPQLPAQAGLPGAAPQATAVPNAVMPAPVSAPLPATSSGRAPPPGRAAKTPR